MTFRNIHRLAGPFLLVTLSISVLYSQQCVDASTTFTSVTTATRTNGNQVQLLNTTTIGGDYANKWQPEDTILWYFNGASEASSEKLDPSTGGPWSDSFSPTLQTYGPGTYSITAQNDAWSTNCGPGGTGILLSTFCAKYGGCSFTLPKQTNASITIQRPGRPDYYPGANHYLYYLGGVAADYGYSAQTAFTPGQANGAPENPPSWVVSYQEPPFSGSLSLSCTNCVNPNVTATNYSLGCDVYDVVVKTSYNGFLSDPFWIFINSPWGTTKANDPVGGTWNYTTALGNGWQSLINYTTQDMCGLTLSGYDMNEWFGSWNPDYPGTLWTPPAPAPWVVSFTQWNDKMNFQCPAGNCVPMPVNPPAGCWPACGVTKVQSAIQNFYFGNWVMGEGVLVQQDTHQRYQDHGEHDSIVTPVSPVN
jgi:hypothetical protein